MGKYDLKKMDSFPLQEDKETICHKGMTFYRYISEAERGRIMLAQETNKREYTFGKCEQKAAVYFTDGKYDTAKDVRSKMALTYTPTYRVEFELADDVKCHKGIVNKISFTETNIINIFNNGKPVDYSSVKEAGGGNEYWCKGTPDEDAKLDVIIKDISTLKQIEDKPTKCLNKIERFFVLCDSETDDIAEEIRKLGRFNEILKNMGYGQFSCKQFPEIYNERTEILETYFNFLKSIDRADADKILHFVSVRVPSSPVPAKADIKDEEMERLEMENLAFISDLLKVGYTICNN